ncbi:MAG: hypothetical protein HRF49_03835 [bacterium]|jgi:hypothetical protein
MTPTGIKTKFYAFSVDATDNGINIFLLFNSSMSPEIPNAFKNDPECREFYPQYCRYYLPLAESIVIGHGNLKLDKIAARMKYVFDSIWYIPGVSLAAIRAFAELAPAECGHTTSNGYWVDENGFKLILGKEDN